jgi:hypothetical protein
MPPPLPYKRGGGIYFLNETSACATTYLLKHGHVLNLSHFFYLCPRCNDQTLFIYTKSTNIFQHFCTCSNIEMNDEAFHNKEKKEQDFTSEWFGV